MATFVLDQWKPLWTFLTVYVQLPKVIARHHAHERYELDVIWCDFASRFHETEVQLKSLCKLDWVQIWRLLFGITVNSLVNGIWPMAIFLKWCLHLLMSVKHLVLVRFQILLIKSVKWYPGGRKNDLIPSISEILSQTWYHCIQHTTRHHMRLGSHC